METVGAITESERDLEERRNLIQFENNTEEDNETLMQSCSRTFSSIGGLFRFNEFLLPMGFFFIQGLLLPNFDDLHYMFLTEIIGMPKYEYDFLNIIAYISIFMTTIAYN